MRKLVILLAVMIISLIGIGAHTEESENSVAKARAMQVDTTPGSSMEPSLEMTAATSPECNSPTGDCTKFYNSSLLTENDVADLKKAQSLSRSGGAGTAPSSQKADE